MLGPGLVAWLHYVAILFTVGMLFVEFVTYKKEMTSKEAKKMSVIDGLYGMGALLIVGTGFARALWMEKGWHYYESNWVFWAKVGVYCLWAVVSLPPTFHFISLRKQSKTGAVTIPQKQYKKIRLCILGQMSLIPIPPLLATLMARGHGYLAP